MSAAWTPAEAHLALLRRSGVDGVEHDSHVPFLAHLVGVARQLRAWEARPELVQAGLFHSIYGTEYFDPELGGPSATREEVRAAIGVEAERIAWLWCRARRASIAQAVGRGAAELVHRDGSAIAVEPAELRDLVELWCADAVEQIHRMSWEESDFSKGLLEVLDLASAPARCAVEAIGARIPSDPD